MYDPTTGRFISRDAVVGDPTSPQSLNRYAYAWNNPATLADPSGTCVGPFAVLLPACVFVLSNPEIVAGAIAATSAVIPLVLGQQIFEDAAVSARQRAVDAVLLVGGIIVPGEGVGDLAVVAEEGGGRLLGESASSVEDLLAMMNKRPGVTAEFAGGEAEAYLNAIGAEGSHTLMEGERSSILLRRGVATRWTAFHEWLHSVLQRRNGGYSPGEDQFIEDFLARHSKLLRLGE